MVVLAFTLVSNRWPQPLCPVTQGCGEVLGFSDASAAESPSCALDKPSALEPRHPNTETDEPLQASQTQKQTQEPPKIP